MCATGVWVSKEAKRGAGSPKTGVVGNCEPFNVGTDS